MTKIKICGITNIEDARLSTRLGADALGFNFYSGSRRYITPFNAGEIIGEMPDGIVKVGVFVNASIEDVLEIIEQTGINALQLHGDENPRYIEELRLLTNCKIIKALRVTQDFKVADAGTYNADAILLDSFSDKERGGTGRTFDWETAKQVRALVDELYLAGGLSPDNVESAISEVRPFAVDTCSAIEARPGIKDSEKLRAFIEKCRRSI